MEKAAPSNNGPSVITVQYNVILVVKCLARETLKIKLKLFSMVDSNIIDVMTILITPMVVNPADAFRKSAKYELTSLPMVGAKLCNSISCICPRMLSKAGKAENIDNPMANNGTIAISEV